jgi:hypothetical protein
MSSATGRYIRLTPARRMIADWMHFCRQFPGVIAERRMSLAPLVQARRTCLVRPSWVCIFLKAFSVVATRRPELRRSYRVFPWPHLYEHSRSLGLVTIERMEGDEPVVLFTKLKYPDRLALTDLDERLRRCQEQPLHKFPMYRRGRRTLWLPWVVRRLLMWGAVNLSGRFLAENIGTFALTSPAAQGAGLVQLQTMLTSTLHYGLFEPDGSLDFRLTFDHRVYDGAFAARVLVDIEQVLLGEVLAEVRSLPAARRREREPTMSA